MFGASVVGLLVGCGAAAAIYFGGRSRSTTGLKKLDQKLSDDLIDCLYRLRKDSKCRAATPGETYDEYPLGAVKENWSVIKFEFPHENAWVGRLILTSDRGAIHLLRVEDEMRKTSIVSVDGFEGCLDIADIQKLIQDLQKLVP